MSLPTLRRRRKTTETDRPGLPATDPNRHAPSFDQADICSPIADVRWRQSVRVTGRVRSVRIRPWADVAALECTLVDDTGGLTVVFLGRRKVPGIHPGTRMTVEGVVGDHHEKLAMLNPDYTLIEA